MRKKDDSRKGAKDAKFKDNKGFFKNITAEAKSLSAWREE